MYALAGLHSPPMLLQLGLMASVSGSIAANCKAEAAALLCARAKFCACHLIC